MIFYIFASLIIFSFVISRAIKKGDRTREAQEQQFWDREAAANAVRKKDIDHLPYIKIPLESLPLEVMSDQPKVAECIRLIQQLSENRILNLTGYTNTDLKLEYGTANLAALSGYDQNYTVLVRTLQKWADELLQNNYIEEARTLMEFAISTRTDVSSTYYRLAEYYASHNEKEKIQQLLIETAQSLHSSNKEIIVRTLRETYL